MAKKVLVVDDEVDLVETMKLRLEAEGFEVVTARDGMEGLRVARETKPDIILLDVMMPKIDGYQVCRMLKFSAEFKDTPIIMLSARGQDQDKITGNEVGANCYMTKPFDGKELINKINELLK